MSGLRKFSVFNRAHKIGRIELPCSACAGVYLKTNHNKLSGGLLARAAHPPVLAEAAAAAVLATVAPPPVLLAETVALCKAQAYEQELHDRVRFSSRVERIQQQSHSSHTGSFMPTCG